MLSVSEASERLLDQSLACLTLCRAGLSNPAVP